jgi:hypothetical protein
VTKKRVPVKLIAEQHVIEDCGFIPTVQDYLKPLKKSSRRLDVESKNKTY